ncbi:MAG: DNA repair exonuclease [Methanobacterium sp.]|nr:DNA repair exonuclease [Methanobacterium sp.]
MQFIHMADTHLGYRQYGLSQRENDFLNVFNNAINEAINERPDFIIHSGDLFEYSRPPTKALLTAQDGISRLKKQKIPIYAIAGNHDIVMKKNSIPPQILYKDFGLKIISPKNPYFIEKDVFIGGAPYSSSYTSKHLVERLQTIEKVSSDYKKTILVLHQGIDRYMPYEYEIKIGEIPQTFNYCAFGHIHERIVDDFGKGKLAYPGSTEIWRSNEVEGYKKNGKGFYLVDISGDLPEIEKIDIKLPREFLKETIQYIQLQEEIIRINDFIMKLKEKPILNITVTGGNFSRSEVYEIINQTFSNNCLSVRSKYLPDIIDENLDINNIKKDTFNIKRMIKEHLKDFNNEKVSNLATELYKEMSEGNFDKAEDMTKKFYEELNDN